MKNSLTFPFFILTFSMLLSGCGIQGKSAPSSNADSHRLYESFLAGEEKVIFTESGDTGVYYDFSEALTKDSGYTLPELTNALSDYITDSGWGISPTVGEISSDFIDCGLDGTDELFVDIALPIEGIDDFSVQMIIKAKSNKLYICYNSDSWSRSQTTISKSGFITGSGSGGASSSAATYSYVDADGAWKFWYGCNSEIEFTNYFALTDSESGYEILDFSSIDTSHFNIDSYYLESDTEKAVYYPTCYFYNEDYSDVLDNSDPSIAAVFSECQRIFDDHGITMYTQDEIDSMLKEKQEEISLTDEIINY